jgi:hypothetical protein
MKEERLYEKFEDYKRAIARLDEVTKSQVENDIILFYPFFY